MDGTKRKVIFGSWPLQEQIQTRIRLTIIAAKELLARSDEQGLIH